MMASFTLPYFVDEASLPTTLPTAEEIESATEILNERMSGASGKVVGVGNHFIVKYGAFVNLQEGQTMLFLQHSSTIPVPRIYALYQKPGPNNDTYSYIVMERIRGPSLASVWLKMGQTEKEAVASKLRHVFEEMRRLESPGGYCSFGRCGLTDSLFDSGDDSTSFNGPFDTESDLNEAMIARYASEGHSKHKTQHFSRAFKDVFQNHAPVFTHADFQRKNVMLRKPSATTENGLVQWASTDLELVIIDWEFAGWYPSYWEYSRALFGCGAWKDDWSDWIEKMLEPYRNEYAWVLLFLTELFS
jgi:aminoglycoside phosphotransferase (APT) family kinase protein